MNTWIVLLSLLLGPESADIEHQRHTVEQMRYRGIERMLTRFEHQVHER